MRSEAVQLLLNATSIPPLCPAVPELRLYKSSSPLIKSDLPAKLDGDTALDLRLLTGHLYNPTTKSPTLIKILSNLSTGDHGTCTNRQLLLAAHGLGKSKTIFDVARERYVILFDCIGHLFVAETFAGMKKAIDENNLQF